MPTMPIRVSYQRGDVLLIRLDSIEGRQSGLLSDSVVMTANLATIAATEIGRRIGAIEMTIVDEALRYTLNLPLG